MNEKTPGSPLKFTQLLGRGGLGRLVTQARTLAQLREELAKPLPGELAEGWQLARLDQEALVITVDTPARATRMRYAQSALLHAAQAALGVRPRSVRIKVVPQPRRPKPAQRRELSPEVGELLTSAGASMEDARLGRALLKLARHARKNR
jgi:hypothetical protein